MKKLLIIGSLNLDMAVNVDHMPAVGETIISDKMDLIPGGKGANQACAAGRLHADVTIFGAVGDDTYADIQIASLQKAGVNVSEIIRRKDASTGIALIAINSEGDNSIVVVSGANATLSCRDIDEHIDLLKEADIILFQMEIPVSTVLYGARRAKEFGKTVILDPAPVPKEFPEELYRYVDVIKPNETELHMLTGIEDIEAHLPEAAGWLKARGVKNVLVTLGEKGVYLEAEGEEACRIAAMKVDAVDTTAAGDSFTAALGVMLAEGKSLKEAAVFANFMSALVVTRKGAQSSIPSLEEVQEYIRKSDAAIQSSGLCAEIA